MQRSSDTIGTLAAALAKAQLELTNPEKSLTATIVSPFPREEAKTFRYAPLSTGLEIVRKCLGKHEIAAVQTTAIDKESGLIRLTTTLAHASGEWLSSEWPVCPVSETTAPHRLGAALTYARRHSLFALVGIAGDDDRDAPDLQPEPDRPGAEAARPATPLQNGFDLSGLGNGTGAGRAEAARNGYASRRPLPPARPPRLSPEASAAERIRLLEALASAETAEALAAWAHRAIPVKNRLTPEDAQTVEEAFIQRSDRLHASTAGEIDAPLTPVIDRTADTAEVAARPDERREPAPARDVSAAPALGGRRRRSRSTGDAPAEAPKIDKSVLAFPEPKRIRDKQHLKFVATQPCLICGRAPSDAHHIRFAQLRALGRKVSDEFTVPLCRTHHRQVHQTGNEPSWWQQNGLDPLKHAQVLWARTRPKTNGHLRQDTVKNHHGGEAAERGPRQ